MVLPCCLLSVNVRLRRERELCVSACRVALPNSCTSRNNRTYVLVPDHASGSGLVTSTSPFSGQVAVGDDMLLAILGPRAVGGPRRLTQHLLRSGRQTAWAMITELPASERAAAESEAAAMSDDGVRVLLCDDQAYPDRLRRAPGAPPALFYRGSLKLLDTPAVGICGSRNASPEGLRAARA